MPQCFQAWHGFSTRSLHIFKKNIPTPLPNGAMEPREPGDPADGSETEKSLAALFFFTLSWRNGLALKSGCHRYIEAVVTAPLKPINRHPQTYIQSFVMPLPKYLKNNLQTLNVFDFILGIFSCSSLWSANGSDKLKCITC